jgi:hypothetical protein
LRAINSFRPFLTVAKFARVTVSSRRLLAERETSSP